MTSCRTCVFAVPASDIDGFCRRFPPQLHSQPNGAMSGSFPPVHLDKFWCGEFAAAKKAKPPKG